ncbi:MAG: hypothetical protein JST64_09975, partial [Actinobacteria bacterium]|nr:hypothetical protein [Actinomycetota bacterium]
MSSAGQPERSTHPATGVLAAIGGVFAAFGLFMGAWTVSTPEIEAALGGGPGRLGAVLSVALIVAAGANTVGGALAEHRGTTAAMRSTLATWAAILVVGSTLPTPWGVAIAVIAALSAGGAVDVVANVAATAGLADRPGRLVRLHAVYNVGGAAGTVLVGVMIGLVGSSGWRWAWLAAAATVVVILVAAR